MAISTDQLSTVMEAYKKKDLDGQYRPSPLIEMWKKVSGIKEESGRVLAVPLILEEHAGGTAKVNGDEALSLSVNRIHQRGLYNWANQGYPVILTKQDINRNSGDKAVVKLAEKYLKSAHNKALRDLNQKIVANTGAAFPELTSFYGPTVNGQATGIFEELAFGSQTNLVGGVNKASFVRSYQHQFGNVVNDWSANGALQLDRVVRLCKHMSPDREDPHLILASTGAMTNISTTLMAQQRYQPRDQFKAGSYDLIWQGTPVVMEPDMPASGTDLEEFSCYVLNLKNITLSHTPKGWFDMSEWVDLLPGALSGIGCELNLDVAVAVEHLPSSGVIVDGDLI